MKLLYITRKYPPSVGGMEKVNYALSHEFASKVDTTIVAWGKSQRYLVYFLINAFIRSIYVISAKRITHIHLGDGLLAPLGLILKKFFGISCSVTVHGLDVTYKLPIYQLLVPKLLAQLDVVICVSTATKEECIKRGIPKKKDIRYSKWRVS